MLNISGECQRSRWKKLLKVVEKDQDKILGKFQIQTRHSSDGQEEESQGIIDDEDLVRKMEHEYNRKYQALTERRKKVQGDGNRRSCGNWKIWGCDPQTGIIAPAEEHLRFLSSSVNPRKHDSIKDPQVPRFLLVEKNLKGIRALTKIGNI